MYTSISAKLMLLLYMQIVSFLRYFTASQLLCKGWGLQLFSNARSCGTQNKRYN